MLYFNDFIKILDIIQDHRSFYREWQTEYPHYIDSLVNIGKDTEENEEYLREYNLRLEALRSRTSSRLAVYIDSPQDVLSYIEHL